VSIVMAKDPVVVQRLRAHAREREVDFDTSNKRLPGDRLEDRSRVGLVTREDVIRALRRAGAGER
jgi:hypothetical protein